MKGDLYGAQLERFLDIYVHKIEISYTFDIFETSITVYIVEVSNLL